MGWTILGIIAFIFVMGLLVTIHEAGHFITAKKAGILCHEFSIGMGPTLFHFKKGETLYSIRLFPIGGYVSMAGEEVEEDILKGIKKVRLVFDNKGWVKKIIANLENTKYEQLPTYNVLKYDLIGTKEALSDELYISVEDSDIDGNITEKRYTVCRDALVNFTKKAEIQIAPYDRNFVNKPWINRFVSVFAGPFMNIVLAVIIFFVIGLITGYPLENDTKIGEITAVEGSNNSSLEAGDRLTKINGEVVSDWASIGTILDKVNIKNTPNLVLEVNRNNELKTITINPSVFVYSIELAFKVDGTNQAIVGSYSKNNQKTKTYKAGIEAGDIITKIASDKISTTSTSLTRQEILDFFNSKELEEAHVLTITYLDASDELKEKTTQIENYSKKLLDTQEIPRTNVQIGIICANGFNFAKLVYMPFVNTGKSFTAIFRTLGALFTDKSVGIDDLSGPVGIFTLISSATKEGFISILNIAAILSVNLGFMNIIPLPALDGGRLAFMLYEKITGKKPNSRVENIIHTIGLVLLLGLMLFISFNDVLRCVGCK